MQGESGLALVVIGPNRQKQHVFLAEAGIDLLEFAKASQQQARGDQYDDTQSHLRHDQRARPPSRADFQACSMQRARDVGLPDGAEGRHDAE